MLISGMSRVMCEMLRSIEPRRVRCSRCSSRISCSSERIARRCSRTRLGDSSLIAAIVCSRRRACKGFARWWRNAISLNQSPKKEIGAMEFGMFHQFPALPGRSERDAFAEAFEQIDAAERWGLDAMWLAQLHFDPGRYVLSAPLSIAAAVGARTERIKI